MGRGDVFRQVQDTPWPYIAVYEIIEDPGILHQADPSAGGNVRSATTPP